MAVPKRRWSKARSRRSHSANYKLKPLNLVECPQCKELRRTHKMCKSCGYYKGVEVMSVQ